MLDFKAKMHQIPPQTAVWAYSALQDHAFNEHF